jgi:hypothetical protein
MIIVMEPDAGDREVEAVEAKIRSHGLSVHVSRGTERTQSHQPDGCDDNPA